MVEIIKKNWLLIVIAVVVIIFMFIMNGNDFGDKDMALTPVSSVEDPELAKGNQSNNTSVIVDVKGEVVSPGVYETAGDARINDVIKLAGGFTQDADQMHVNLAQIVQDEMIIMVPKLGEVAVSIEGVTAGSEKVQINYATQAEMETLSGIGPSKAQAIIQYRDEHGFFKNAEDLLNVSGIGEKTLENIRDNIQVP